MNMRFDTLQEVVAAYQANTMTRSDVAQWLQRHRAVTRDQSSVVSKPDSIVLQDLVAAVGPMRSAPVSQRPSIVLSALSHEIESRAPQAVAHVLHNDNDCELAIVDYGDGVFSLDVRQISPWRWSQSMVSALAQGVSQIVALPEAKVIVLRGQDDVFLPAGNTDEERNLFNASGVLQLPLACELPVIAVMKGHAEGLSWLLGAACDFMFCGADRRYGYSAPCSGPEHRFLQARFLIGDVAAMLEPEANGASLRDAGLGINVMPREEIDDHALELARQLAQAPRGALMLLKQHLSQEMLALTAPVTAAADQSLVRPLSAMQVKASVWQPYVSQAMPGCTQPLVPSDFHEVSIGSDAVTLHEYANGVALITLCDRQGKNTFTDGLLEGVGRAFSAIRQRPQCKVVVLTGYDSYFSCGGTKASLLAIQSGMVKFTDVDVYSLPLECPLPVIAAMQGHAIGAGWSLGMFCDSVIYSDKHSYVSPYIRYGFTPGAGSTLVFPQKLGIDIAREILFSAHTYSGVELKQRGLPLPVVPASDVLPMAMRLATALAMLPRGDLERMKRDDSTHMRARVRQTLAQEEAMHQQCFVGNKDVLARIQQHFNEGVSMDGNTSGSSASSLQDDSAIFEKLLESLRVILAEELFMQPSAIDDQQKFIDIGLDSITGVNWVRKINHQYGLSINATRVYSHPTLQEFAQHVLKEGRLAGSFQAGRLQDDPAAVPVVIPIASAVVTQPTTIKIIRSSAPITVAEAVSSPVVSAHSVLVAPETIAAERATATLMAEAAEATIIATSQLTVMPKIAVIGMAGQFPMARTLDEYWTNLVEGRDCISQVPEDRWDIHRYFDRNPDIPGKSYSRWMGVLEDAAQFDPMFFNISPREAEWMDPQQRTFLQSGWHCIEDAGYSPAALAGSRCGVFVGCGAGDYGQHIRREDLNAQNFMGRSISILAAKISYLLDLQGPCVSIDTACSSSLVALAAACDSLALGNCDAALAGGVYVMAGPDMHIMTSKAGMLSSDGRCFSFDERANGFVPGEGVGTVMLKRLEDAERDGDQIHGVISGWGVNQDGKTNGITAPNPKAQARLEEEVYRRHGIRPEEIQLVEAHGTGTKLGDPIEVEGLKESFAAFTSQRGYCALGSVKSNIGHLLSAAGIAGTIKLLLALRHRKIPPTALFEKVNEHIELDNSPFYVNSQCQDWTPPPGQIRRAAISSFGFSGTNAHLVIEEYLAKPDSHEAGSPLHPVAVLLSARNAQRLVVQAQQLLDFLARQTTADVSLLDLAYTLQVGREAMEERLAIEVSSIGELRANLQSFVDGCDNTEHIFRGKAQRRDETIALFSGNQELQETVKKWAQSGQLGKVLSMWVRGLSFDWRGLYPSMLEQTAFAQNQRAQRQLDKNGASGPRRISLPGYPFEQKRYWLPEGEEIVAVAPLVANLSQPAISMLHPLLHRNTSTFLSEHRYSSHFSGREFFFAQHVIKGRKVLPGVGHLEMVRAAVKEACGVHADASMLKIKNVVWMRPVACSDGDDLDEKNVVHISLAMEDEGEMAFRIYSGGDHEDQGVVVHSQGVVLLHAVDVIPRLDIEALRGQCSRMSVDAHQHFETMKERGADLGRGFRGIETYHLGADAAGVPQVLARIVIPEGLSDAVDRFVLHPTSMDAAVHTVPPLMAGWEQAERVPLALPFALDELEVLGSCQESMWALARPTAAAKGRSNVSKYDIDLCDDTGMVCVRFKGFSFRVLDSDGPGGGQHHSESTQASVGNATMMLQPVWTPSSMVAGAQPNLGFDRRLVILCGVGVHEELQHTLAPLEVISLTDSVRGTGTQTDDAAFTIMAGKAFDAVQHLLHERTQVGHGGGTLLLQFVVPEGPLSALTGLVKTLRLENSKITAQVIQVDARNDAAHIAEYIEKGRHLHNESQLRFREGRCEAQHWQQFTTSPHSVPLPWKEQGVYLITGGAGALATIFIREILAQVKSVTLVLTGRSPLDNALQMRLEALKAAAREPASVRIEYRQVDIAQSDDVAKLIGSIQHHHRHLNGILHSAGINRDNFILVKSKAELEQVLAPKVAGVMHLQRATQSLDLDFIVLFSSIASGIGNAGQADYAMANAFLDMHAQQSTKTINKRRVLSINWPLWQHGGMVLDAQTERWMHDNTGLVPMRTATGIDAFYQALNTNAAQIMVLEGNVDRIQQWLQHAREASSEPASAAPTPNTEPNLMLQEQQGPEEVSQRFDAVLAELKPVVASILKLNRHELDIDKELINYGFDSITLTELTNNLNKQYQISSGRALNPTVFFEHTTLRSFAGYLAAEYPQVAAPVQAARSASIGKREISPSAVDSSMTSAAAIALPPRRNVPDGLAAPRSVSTASKGTARQSAPIAVVGMSARLPMARDVHEYWSNLVSGRDCISEVPSDRWDWREIYGDPSQDGNQTDVKWGGFIDGVAEFDPFFFGLSPRETLFMDPMQRLLMLHMWHAIEDAGYSAKALSGTRTSIFVGTSVSEYGMLLHRANVPCDAFLPTGRSASLGANRMSYVLNITGASETVDTACSSSLVAIHRAVVAMDSGDCDMALVGGVNTLVAPDGHISFRKAGMLSVDGRCKTFSKNADGYVRGEGCGILFLKRLDAAERDGDHIYGLIRGSGENHGGRANSLTAPNPKAQSDLLKTVYTQAGIDPRTVGYIEAHGTGTALGDPVEVNGLKMAFRDLYQATGDAEVMSAHCGIGSAKSNIGHLELAAGVAGAIKVLLQLKHKTLAKSLHCDEVNPYIQLDGSPFHVVGHTQKWPAIRDANDRELPRRAGVSSFGFGGANAHIVFEEYIAPQSERESVPKDADKQHLLVLSARNEKRLKDAVQQLLEAIRNGRTMTADGSIERFDEQDLERIAYTLQVGREPMDERLALKASSLSDLSEKLEIYLAGTESVQIHRGQVVRNDSTLALFDEDELNETVAKWVARGQHEKILALWVKGHNLNWHVLHADQSMLPQRISLPGYPFARERYWPEPSPVLQGISTALPAQSLNSPLRSRALLTKGWVRTAPISTLITQGEGTVLLLATDQTLSLAKHLHTQITAAEIVNLSDTATSDAQLRDVKDSQAVFAGCIDLVGCGTQSLTSMTWLGYLQQLIGKQAPSDRPALLLGVSRGLELEGGSINLAGASRAGLYRMLQSEYAKLRSRHLDVAAADDEATMSQQILAEWHAESDEPEVRYHHGQREVAELQSVALPEAPVAMTFPQDRVLLITGGTRGIGLLCAEHFVARYGVRKLVLTGREALPPRAQWAQIVESVASSNAMLARKIEAVQRLERNGVQVETSAVSLSDHAAMQAAIQRVTASMGPVGGVLHCAGLNDWDNPAFVRKPVAQFQGVLEPKVAGLDVLLDVVRDQPLQFVALFSSVSAAVPSLGTGQSDYVAANAYMDYVARARVGSLPIVSIQWPSWKDTGMGEATSKTYRQTGLLSHTDTEGLQLLDLVLSHRLGPVVLPAVIDPALWQPQRLMLRSLDQSAASTVPQSVPVSVKPRMALNSNELMPTALAWLGKLFGKELMVAPDSLDHDVPFQDYGVDSIMLTQLLRRVDGALNAGGKTEPLDPSVFYEHPTLGAFAAWLIKTHPTPMTHVLGSPPPTAVADVPTPALPNLASPSKPAPVLPIASHKSVAPWGQTNMQGIAVVGMSCQFPGAPTLDAFWQMLSEGRSAIRPVPASRWGQGMQYKAGLLDNVTDFDPAFFLLRDDDAKAMDPQALLLLEESLNLMAHAGYSPHELKGSATGVYIGARSTHRPELDDLLQARNPILAVGQNYLAANISQFFDLRGPSLVLDTACSSALVGMNMAVQSLQLGEITAALVAGVSVLPSDAPHRLFEQRNLLSASGDFHVLDGRAGGIVLGEGIGMVMLKTVEQAVNDGDHVYAVIKGLAINNDGRTAGPATPNLVAQKAVMQQALQRSGADPRDVRYVHVNASGSEITDLLELKAMEAVYRPLGSELTPCELGSMEPNIGHPLCAKGIAAFIHVTLMLSRQQRVPFLSGQQPMTHYDLDASAFHFGRAVTPWGESEHLAAINCFADGGTNAHVLLKAWTGADVHNPTRQPLPTVALKRRPVFGLATVPAVDAASKRHVWSATLLEDPAQILLTIDHPVLRNHQAYGQELLPGLAYIDLLYQHFERMGLPHQHLELRNLSIYQPLIVSQHVGVLLEVKCISNKDGHWQIQLQGCEKRGELLSEIKRYATAEMLRIGSVQFDDVISPEQVRLSATRTQDLAMLYARCREHSLSHTGFIKAQGQVHDTAEATYIDIAIGNDAIQTADDYLFHPTLIDGSSVGAQGLFASMFEGEDRLILPLFYESFRACAPLRRSCITRIPLASLRRKNELLYMNMEFFDATGRKVAELLNYACKLVRDEGAINPERKQVGKSESAAPLAPKPEPSIAMVSARTSVSAPVVVATVEDEEGSPAERFLVTLMAERIDIPADQIDASLGYYELGLDSARLLDLVTALEAKLDTTLSPTLLFEYTTIVELASYLMQTYPMAWQAPDVVSNGSVAGTAGHADAVMIDTAPTSVAVPALAMPRQLNQATAEDIAIIGMAGRYPGANTLDEFWSNLKAGKDSVTEVPSSRWEPSRLHGVNSPSGKPMSQWGGFIDNPDCFDAQFFRVSPWEAKLLDPQQRLFLEACWEAIEDAGYTPQTLVEPRGRNHRRNVGVYVGVMHNDYAILAADAASRGEPMPVSLNYAQIANRVSYFCNFHGPSMAIDTVCSSSLIAVHLAMESLRSGECEVALAGGVNLSLHPVKYMTYGLMDMHASDGRCRSFGKGGDGYVSGEAIGTVLLKPLSKAIADNDHVYAVIKGSTTNHVGTVSGLTVPSPVAQADMIEACLERTGIHPRTISYVEAHGTGTSLGDPIEIQGLSKAFGHYTHDRQFCAIGSVKSNIGHAESAAGISGLTKLALQLHHKVLVPSLHSTELNPYLDFANSPFFVQHVTEVWRQPIITIDGIDLPYPRRAALSSFGASGSNAHLILEEYSPPLHIAAVLPFTADASKPVLVPLSARKPDRLMAYARRLLDHLQTRIEPPVLSDLAYTLQVGREAMEERVVFVAADVDDLVVQLQDFVASDADKNGSWVRGTAKKGRKSSALTSQQIAQWITDVDVRPLAAAWVQGGMVDWATLHHACFGEISAHRISLPTYPFAKERHWVELPTKDMAMATAAPSITSKPVVSASTEHDVVYFVPRWQAQSLPPASVMDTESEKSSRRSLFVVTDRSDLVERLRAQRIAEHVVQLTVLDDIAKELNHHLLKLLDYCKDPERIRKCEPEQLIVVAPHLGSDYPYRSLMGALRTISMELPFIRTRLVLDAALTGHRSEPLEQHLRAEFGLSDGFTEVAYPQDQARQVLTQHAVDLTQPPSDKILTGMIRQNGIYVITGGLGGLGFLFAEQLGRDTGARIVLTGRSLLNANRKALLGRLHDKGINAEYVPCDTSHRDDVKRLVDHLVDEYGTIHGVLHSAGVVADNFIPKKTAAEVSQVLSAKVPAILHLDEATRHLALDFFVSFSSAAALGNPGQFDYATANAFLDSFACHRTALVARGERSGRSLSINWPLWKDGGMSVQPTYEKFMRDQYGIVPLQEASGVHAFAAALLSSEPQVGVFEGDGQRIHRLLSATQQDKRVTPPRKSSGPALVATTSRAQMRGVEDMVRQALAEVLGMKPTQVELEVEFADYGMDSIGATKVASHLNSRLGLEFTGAVFLELNTAEKLIEHLRERDMQAGPEPAVVAASVEALVTEDVTPVERQTPACDQTQQQIVMPTLSPRQMLFPTDAVPSFRKVAIIGYDAQLPGAANVETYWQNILAKSIAIREVPLSQWSDRGVSMQSGNDGDYTAMQHAALLDEVDRFDPDFWEIGETAAREMDPQQRLLMQSIWRCVERAGYSMKALTQKKVGLFLALDSVDYQSLLKERKQGAATSPTMSVGLMANQMSYFCNFKGPSEAIDNACASTYVALKRAAQAIAWGECDTAIVGGAKILLDPVGFVGRDEGEILSRSGSMYPFDAQADGYIRGEGVGCVLLKGLDRAVGDQDQVHAVVVGVGVSHNGRGGLSQVAPSVEGQYQAIREAYEVAGVSPETVSYIEAHGTSNSFSDASELAAFKKFFRESMSAQAYQRHRCAVSTVKANIGHLEGASGVASLIKSICAIREGVIAPIANWSKTHPSILLDKSPFYFPDTVTEWKRTDSSDGEAMLPRRVGLHSIGIGGVNAHVLLEEHVTGNVPVIADRSPEKTYELIVLSAKTRPALKAYVSQWHDYLVSLPDAAMPALADIAYSAREGRDEMRFRVAYVVDSVQALVSLMASGVEHIAIQGVDEENRFAAANEVISSSRRNELLTHANSLDRGNVTRLKWLARAWLSGATIDWQPLAAPGASKHSGLPTYPFQDRKVWCTEPLDPFAVLFYETFAESPASRPVESLAESAI